MRTENNEGHIHVSFVFARSGVAPRKQMTIPRLELSAALTGAHVANILQAELTVDINHVILWSDSSTVLQWLKSDSCSYKVFVGTRVAKIQSLTDIESWRYVDAANNSADVITRGQSLKDLTHLAIGLMDQISCISQSHVGPPCQQMNLNQRQS